MKHHHLTIFQNMGSFPADLAGLRSKLCSTLSGALRNRVRMLEKCRCQNGWMMIVVWLVGNFEAMSYCPQGSCGKKLVQHFFHGFKTVLDLIGSGWFFLSPVLETRAAFAGLNLAPDGCVPDDQQCKFFVGSHDWKTSKVKVNVHNAHE